MARVMGINQNLGWCLFLGLQRQMPLCPSTFQAKRAGDTFSQAARQWRIIFEVPTVSPTLSLININRKSTELKLQPSRHIKSSEQEEAWWAKLTPRNWTDGSFQVRRINLNRKYEKREKVGEPWLESWCPGPCVVFCYFPQIWPSSYVNIIFEFIEIDKITPELNTYQRILCVTLFC